MKRQLLLHVKSRGISLKDWFLASAEEALRSDRLETGAPEHGYSAFISHAHEDKEAFVRPLAEELGVLGHKIWYDEFELEIGDSLRASIDQGLRASRFGIVVLSPFFLQKDWPKYELDGLLAREIGGKKVILPIWYGLSREELIAYSPSLVDKVALVADGKEIPYIARELAAVLCKP